MSTAILVFILIMIVIAVFFFGFMVAYWSMCKQLADATNRAILESDLTKIQKIALFDKIAEYVKENN